MLIGVPSASPTERRVALTPDAVVRIVASGHSVRVQSGAGVGAGFPDDSYQEAGAELVDGSQAWATELVVLVSPPDSTELASLSPGTSILGLLRPLDEPQGIQRLAERGVTCYAFETVPRTMRAQTLDALSSQATAAGYQAVMLAATRLRKFFPMLTTAAGTVRPAKVLVLGAGVAGLQAIATARRLGAVVSAFDVRKAAAEQVESLGASFVAVDVEQQDQPALGGYARLVAEDEQRRILDGLAPHVAESDVVICTAQIPGRPAPLLVTNEMVGTMRPGSVIVDLAAGTGGNCQATESGGEIDVEAVTIIGYTDLAARVAGDASRMYAHNCRAFIELLAEADPHDEILAGARVAAEGKVLHQEVAALLEVP